MNMNPVMALMNMVRSGGNPMVFMQQMARSNPQAAQAMNLINGKSQAQIRNIVENMCRERGTTVEQVARSIGLPMR